MDTERLIHLASQRGLIDDEKLAEAREEKGRQSAAGNNITLWEALCLLGYISDEQGDNLRANVETTTFTKVTLKGYAIGRRLGSGGFGDLYIGKAEDGREVVVKLLPRRFCDDPEHVARFEREGELSSAVEHPHLVKTIARGSVDRRPYLIMEEVRGPSLRERIRDSGALNQYEGLVILKQIGEGLRALRTEGIVHRDVKPGNIILGPPREDTEEPFCAKLCDFGLATGSRETALERKDGTDADEEKAEPGKAEDKGTGVTFGTPHYMSPEQAAGADDIDFRTDMYGLGATLYYALVGQTVFSGKTSAIITRKQVTESIDVEPLRDRGFDPALVELLRDLLRREPAERPAGWDEVVERVDRIIPQSLAVMQPAEVDITNEELLGPAAFVDTGIGAQSLLHDLPDRRRAVFRMLFLVVAIVLFVSGLVFMLLPGDPGSQERMATPENITEALTLIGRALADESDAEGVLLLEPGVYREPLTFTASHAGLVIDATRAGVVMEGAGDTVIRCESGCKGLVVRGLRLQALAPAVVEVEPGCEVRFERCLFTGAPLRLRARSSDVALDDVRWCGGLELAGGSIELRSSIVHDAGTVVDTRETKVTVAGSRLRCTAGEGPTVLLRGGMLEVDLGEIEVGAEGTGLRTEDCFFVGLRRLLLHGGETGWDCRRSQVKTIADFRLSATATGLVWEGDRDESWTWSKMNIAAETPVAGISDLELDGAASEAEAILAALPR